MVSEVALKSFKVEHDPQVKVGIPHSKAPPSCQQSVGHLGETHPEKERDETT